MSGARPTAFAVLTAALAAALLTVPVPGSAATAPPPAPVDVCVTADRRLAELSGLVGVPQRYAISDGGRRVQVNELGPDCAVVGTITGRVDPYDGEDLARAADGTFWIADIGDNDLGRDTVAFVLVAPDGSTRLHRLTYPDGPHDAEALLLGRDGRPVIVTKDPAGAAGVYVPEGPVAEPGPTPLRKAGEVTVPTSRTEGGPIGALGSRLVTGGAVSADGRVVALRTYTDAWLYPAPDGDPVAALTREPVQVPLPGEPQGEAIAFEPDGTLLSGSESPDGSEAMLRAVPRAASLVELPPVDGQPGAQPAGSLPIWQVVLAALGVAAVAAFGFGMLRRRR